MPVLSVAKRYRTVACGTSRLIDHVEVLSLAGS